LTLIEKNLKKIFGKEIVIQKSAFSELEFIVKIKQIA